MADLTEQNLVSQICHEIGNPLTLIHSTIQFMESQNPRLGDMDNWNQLREDVEGLSHLFRELSAYNHCDRLHPAPTDLYELFYDLMDSFQTLAFQKGVRFAFDDSEPLPDACEYSCDPTKLKQALTNLIKNAIEAADSPSTLTLAIGSQASQLALSVENAGPELSKSERERIFLPFHTTKEHGSGLGLPITARIVQAHGGRVQADSGNGRTTFTLYLPLS